MKKQDILNTINLMIQQFKTDEHILCFLGLGSLSNQSRLDDYSDLDFFLIVEKGYKKSYLESLFWLDVKPIAYQFKNTQDGYKVLYEDGVFLEFAVFEEEELRTAEFSPGKILYMKETFDVSLVEKPLKQKNQTPSDYRVNEILTNLYIGLLRDKRGEKASGHAFIQVYAMNHIYQLLPTLYLENKEIDRDQYVPERRIEFRVKNQEHLLASMMQGYNHNRESAKAILNFIHKHYDINEALKDAILELIKESK
ncbi:MAG: hypothetical protein EP317_00585 [Bacillota bacterium]|nr:MAG: hypothetical protein EP317_00585 [Bacillota bacterium]